MTKKKAKKIPVFDYSLCMACRDCVLICPLSCLVADKTDVDYYKKAYPRLGNNDGCDGCAICAKDCPVNAITMVDRASIRAA
jgi:Pyruvate/2-oxoacid:ferredoxin oxidoreductase delta subunit